MSPQSELEAKMVALEIEQARSSEQQRSVFRILDDIRRDLKAVRADLDSADIPVRLAEFGARIDALESAQRAFVRGAVALSVSLAGGFIGWVLFR